MTIDIPSILDRFTTSLIAYGYVGLFVASFISALAVPIPAYIVLAGSGALAAQGYFNIYLVLIIALAGNVSADLTGYFLARKYGKEVVQKIGFGRLFKSRAYNFLEDYIEGFPQPIIFVTRLVTEAGPIVNILAGLGKVKTRTFVIYDIIGESCYVLLFGLAGYFLGDAWKNNTGFLSKGIAMLVLLGILAGLTQLLVRKYSPQSTREAK